MNPLKPARIRSHYVLTILIRCRLTHRNHPHGIRSNRRHPAARPWGEQVPVQGDGHWIGVQPKHQDGTRPRTICRVRIRQD
ncbi:hypothetical protein KNU94_gp38 [Xanthomonas phage FoX2]|uniref:Uncharacterized protein n=2 Tax=Foxunavirus TaxID=2948712 RepID=A0A858NQP0_9CAUD|nr:hypothetical protein KNU93_gp37 [Xanthomonas phage FoX1]YP_010106781.1 hypothetical protein KNU94_gp38 [Xanthomonas phage FoX2]QJB21812.1 hypothetical protein XccvBFoX1_gp73c [Xanthomonas phage FoX1]QJB21894.1 hypothetical protein XccvBFoX2_gp75c [Xanthomonas phage FoX2]